MPLSRCCLFALLLASQVTGIASSLADTETEAPALKISYALDGTASEPVQAGPQTVTQSDLWVRLRAGFHLGDANPTLTHAQEQWFRAHPDYVQRGIARSRLYLYFIADEVEKRGMPMEFALLPMIESAYNPLALSPMNASGIWQFMPGTGKVYGLKQNAWYDGRRDVLTATRAALDYLQNLHTMFGDWDLALAAYNCGEGCVARAQARRQGKPVDYASLNLPMETRNYVPKLIAMRNVLLSPDHFGIHLGDLPNEPYFMQVTLSQPMEAKQAARLAEMDLTEFLSLNPGFQRRVIYTETNNILLLPTERVEAFQFNLHRLGGVDRLSLHHYQARRGESASKIAGEFGVTLDWLKEHNPLTLFRGKVAKAQTLLVPASTKVAHKEPLPPLASVKQQTMRTHTVRRGDTLYLVAKLYHVTVADIRRWNEHAEPLQPGVTLEIPTPG